MTLSLSKYTDDSWASGSRIQPGGLRLPLRIQAHDGDSGSNAHIIYRLLPLSSSSQYASNSDVFPFAIDAESGEILLTHSLQSSSENYGFFVEACDQPANGRSLCSEPVGVTVNLAPQKLSWHLNITCNSVPISEVSVYLYFMSSNNFWRLHLGLNFGVLIH